MRSGSRCRELAARHQLLGRSPAARLDAAYAANTGMSVASVKASQYKVIASEGLITIHGLNGGEKVSLFDITGRQFKVTIPSSITIKSGMYIVKVNDYVTKVIVK